MTGNSILLIAPSSKMEQDLKNITDKYNIVLNIAKTALDGMAQCLLKKPALIVIDNNLPDINGISLTSILKDTKHGNLYTVYVFNVDTIIRNMKADYIFPIDFHMENLIAQIKLFLDKLNLQQSHSEEIERAKIKQNKMLPPKIETNKFRVDNIYSPFAELSGDGLDYWLGQDETGLYGLLFDCVGHDIVSFLQVGEIRALLKKGCTYYQSGVYKSLSEIMKNVNNDLFALHGEDTVNTAAVIFYLDFKENILHYCSAGIPNFFVKYKDTAVVKEIRMKNYLIGYEENTAFKENTFSLGKINEIIFSSDGFSELMFNKLARSTDIAKHDDVSAILISLKRDNG